MTDHLTNDLPKRLRTVSDMINMGEKISWGQETALMDEAAAEIERLRNLVAEIRFHAFHSKRIGWDAGIRELLEKRSSEYQENK